MKFAHSLVLNAVPEWLDQYVDYDRLKKILYQAERQKMDQRNLNAKSQMDKVESGLKSEKEAINIQASSSEKQPFNITVNAENEEFIKELDTQLDKVSSFFLMKEEEFLSDAEDLFEEFQTFNIPLPDESKQPVIETIPTKSALEKLDSGFSGRFRSRRVSRDSYTTMSTSIAESDNEDEGQNLTARERQSSAANTSTVRQSGSETLRNQNQPNYIQLDDDDSASKKSVPTGTSVSPTTHPPARSNTVSVSNLRSRRGSAIERTLSQHENMPAYAEELPPKPPTRIMQTVGLRFGRRRGSHVSMGQPDTVSEFNQYYNFRVRCAATYISLTELKQYASTNRTAFEKILKKWDKVMESNLREAYFQKVVKTTDAFTPENKVRLENALEQVLGMYAAVFTMGKKHNAEIELKMHMRDHIQFERTSVWKDMVGKERQTLDAHAAIVQKGFHIPYINCFVSRKTIQNIIGFLISIILYIVLMCVDTMGQYEASKCLALLIFAALMWAFECIPLFATAFLIPLMIVPMHIIKDSNGNVLPAPTAAGLVFNQMFNDTIMVLLGGFAIAAALSKHGVAKAFASTILSKAGSRPRWVILTNMCLATFLSMWISNVATPVLCFSLVDPILRTLKPNSKVAPCLLMGIALASCIGGLSSPISSPQNIVTINLMNPNPGWGIWFGGALPCAVVCILTTWLLLLLYFRPDRDTPHLNVIKSQGFSRPTYAQVWVCIVCAATIALWCAESSISGFFGNNGVIAAIPFVLLFGTNMLNKTDLNNFLWSVVTLAQGGMALGYAVRTSGLLNVIGHNIASNVNHLSALSVIFIFGMLVLVFATFVSHTVAALVILPIVQQVGQNLPVPRPNLMVMVTGLVSSVAMGLPVSGFPNMNAIMLEDPTGKPYLTIKDFLLCGVPSSIVAAVLTICLGYGIVSGVGY
ncbi:SPX domain-containing protein [Mycotypha africana]|uniref:SPX domain-containing protein n=1 Tax=Mycotypha africana TaxID=64632 RepID=UPI0023004A45|nr:SPX domain-containing protein [Mycotypha africana]KAI8987592.1 SPX domain-containing protein [Mycotypha africana]